MINFGIHSPHHPAVDLLEKYYFQEMKNYFAVNIIVIIIFDKLKSVLQ